MRALHVHIRRTAKTASDRSKRDSLLRLVVKVVGDMRRLGMPIGATEIDACVFSHSRLGDYDAAVGIWKGWVMAKGGGSGSVSAKHTTRSMFAQTHRYALEAAVASRDMQTIIKFVGFNPQLLSKTAHKLLWALFAEGHQPQAMQLYMEMRNPEITYQHLISRDNASDNIEALVTPEILCEVVGGLCRNSRLDDAYSVLVNADRKHRNIYAWNSYFDGLSNRIKKRTSPHDMERVDGEIRAKLERGIREMEDIDGIKPDTYTRNIWMRACFRSGDWESAERYFRDNYEVMSRDVVCWDTCVRGLLESDNTNAVRKGWRLVNNLVSQADGIISGIDSRFVETVLRQMLSRASSKKWTISPYDMLSKSEVSRIFEWAEKNVAMDSMNMHEVVIGSLLDTGRTNDALEIHESLRERGLWLPKSINCMIVRALAMDVTQESGETASAMYEEITRADAFIVAKVPRQHYVAAYFILLKLVLQHRDYARAWEFVDRHYPEIVCEADGQHKATRVSLMVYPNEIMYNSFLMQTKEHGDLGQHRLVLDRMKAHLDTICQKHPVAARRIARVYDYYKSKQ
ncbi:hypothetical protein EV175_001222 [Coemansia sp. RSA 1933]|nr:hypothetical protein EV175_001222 [Coemansia sp. RSA 1933]